MEYGIDYYAEKIKAQFNTPKYFDEEEARDIMGHLYLEAALLFPLQKLLEAGSDTGRIKKYISFIEDMNQNGNDEIKCIVEFVLLEYLLDLKNTEVRRRLYKYSSPKLCETIREVEDYIKNRGY